MEFVAQLVECQVVALVVVGSIPIKLPNASSTVVVQLPCNEQVVGPNPYLKLHIRKASLQAVLLEKKPFSFLVRRCFVDVRS